MNKFIILLLGIMLIGFGSAWSEDEFNNSLSTENLTFSGDENITRWLSVPENTFLANAYMNLSGHAGNSNYTNLCYQESTSTANQTGIDGDCGLDYNGNYIITYGGNQWEFGSGGLVIDGDWDTTGHAPSGDAAYIYFNYTVPLNALSSSLWRVKDDVEEINLSIISTCWDNDLIQFRVDSYSFGSYEVRWNCYDYISDSWNILRSVSSSFPYADIYEEGMYWDMGIYPINLSLQINNTQIWNHTGEFNSTAQTSNFAETINNYISTATAVAGYYLIPFIFHSDTTGILEYLAMIFNNDGIIENSQTYPTTSTESKIETYIVNLSYDSNNFGVITGELNLNGYEYTGTKTGTGNTVIFSADATMPSIDTETNYTAYWTISLTDVDGTNDYNLTSHNVTVEIINLSLCDATNNVPFWNYTILNESNVAEINSTFEATFTVKVVGSTTENIFSYSDTTETNSQYDFCISPGRESYTIDTNIKLTKSGFVDKFYNYEEVIVTNATREDNLYMLVSGDSTSYIIHVVDVSGSNIEEAEVRVQRYYPGTAEWLTTEIVTTNYIGKAIGHLLSEDADYRFRVYQNGVSTYNSTATKIICASAPCTVTLIIPLTLKTGFEEIEDLTSTLTYSDTTNVFTYTYSDSSGDFDSARLYVIRVFPSNGTLVIPCNETKTTVSGIITCDISLQINGTYRATSYITRDDEEFLDKRIDGVRGTDIYNSIGVDGILWGFFILIAIVMLGIERPSLAIIFGVLGLIVVGLIGIVNIGAISIIAIVAIAMILLMRVGRE